MKKFNDLTNIHSPQEPSSNTNSYHQCHKQLLLFFLSLGWTKRQKETRSDHTRTREHQYIAIYIYIYIYISHVLTLYPEIAKLYSIYITILCKNNPPKVIQQMCMARFVQKILRDHILCDHTKSTSLTRNVKNVALITLYYCLNQ